MTPTQLALTGIDWYQGRWSGRRGATCAHLVAHGGLSCSAAVAALIRDHGLGAALGPILGRFADCARAAAQVRAVHGTRVEGVCCCGPIPIPFGWGRR